ncbi:hypothetical protein B0J11DRAFT_130578 [Dendryphion nanum]|uniref:2EXR domain-containing protein n=1 Tax=Dendryphion nanum TaxID=256645 RepID=A0A9P9IAZ0_9PLEO|nr:hypothetical protein B0J11DRAFT_130578 [Dendryphion nanum]
MAVDMSNTSAPNENDKMTNEAAKEKVDSGTDHSLDDFIARLSNISCDVKMQAVNEDILAVTLDDSTQSQEDSITRPSHCLAVLSCDANGIQAVPSDNNSSDESRRPSEPIASTAPSEDPTADEYEFANDSLMLEALDFIDAIKAKKAASKTSFIPTNVSTLAPPTPPEISTDGFLEKCDLLWKSNDEPCPSELENMIRTSTDEFLEDLALLWDSNNDSCASESKDMNGAPQDDKMTPSPFLGPTFDLFPNLPLEIRNRIYVLVLVSDRAIIPHLCGDISTHVQFHDRNQANHNAISEVLPITRVSKQIRQESHPIFYKCNTFHCGPDTALYFDHLSYLGRLKWVHKVSFPVPIYRHTAGIDALPRGTFVPSAVQTLAHLMKAYGHAQDIDWKNPTPEELQQHPLFVGGGLEGIGTLLALRQLSTAYISTNARTYTSGDIEDFSRQLVIRVPTLEIFRIYPGLCWFSTLASALGIKVRFVQGGDVCWMSHSSGFIFEWRNSFQKRGTSVEENDVPDEKLCSLVHKNNILIRAKNEFREVGKLPASKALCYYRNFCRGGGLVWFRIPLDGEL